MNLVKNVFNKNQTILMKLTPTFIPMTYQYVSLGKCWGKYNRSGVYINFSITEFTVTTKSSALDMNESFSTMAFYMYGGMYNIFNGTEVDNIHVDFVNADSGEIISSSDSKNLEDSEQ